MKPVTVGSKKKQKKNFPGKYVKQQQLQKHSVTSWSLFVLQLLIPIFFFYRNKLENMQTNKVKMAKHKWN